MLVRRGSGTAAPSVSARNLRQLSVPVPPLATQRAIVQVLDAFDEKISAHQRISQVTTDLRDLLAPQFLTGAIRPA
ncbi:restriction endonuclease subunit S [Pseudofrankia sp. BMG5.37]|uniref:restriction endonuclease subunit S n=1 Tax=Pseudofrankia sp. BMG5.37 TaxID=3050035 RepID=UPI0028961D54|nr:restriction endonuclease subunit S [Pseudofrankia sp. BMG5.37]MDT3441468.1 restriction endonuclease subunit S [Pseudofrankia sp. BMG5.37]